jgi:hypothetical protein
MHSRRVLMVAVLFFSGASFAQQNCAYTFSWTKPTSFSFCVSTYGTIGMIQSPIGTNHLDPVNPVEGFAWFIQDSSGGQASGAQISGVDTGAGFPTFSQPNGPGTLPVIASYSGDGFVETINANPTQRTITTTFKIRDCGFDCEWEGSFSRAANPELDGKSVNNFGSSGYAGFAFLNHGLMLSQPEPAGCGGIDPAGTQDSVYETCGGQPFTGTGAIYSAGGFSTQRTHHATLTFIYRVF